MNKTFPLLACTFALAVSGAVLAQGKAANSKKLYCWNENGAKVCGDALPASAVDSARTEFNATSGRATGQLARALTAEERAIASANAKAAQEAAILAETAARRDRAMAESYATEDELRRAFGERQAVMDETVKASTIGVEGRRQTLVALLRRAGEDELNGKSVPRATRDNVLVQHDQLLRQQAMLVQQLAERETIDEELAAALDRYNALKKPAKDG